MLRPGNAVWQSQTDEERRSAHLCCTTLTGRSGGDAERRARAATAGVRIGTSLSISRPGRFLRLPWEITRPLQPTEAAACRAAKFACSPLPHSSLLQRGRHVSPKHTWDTHALIDTRGFTRTFTSVCWMIMMMMRMMMHKDKSFLRLFDGACAPFWTRVASQDGKHKKKKLY